MLSKYVLDNIAQKITSAMLAQSSHLFAGKQP